MVKLPSLNFNTFAAFSRVLTQENHPKGSDNTGMITIGLIRNHSNRWSLIQLGVGLENYGKNSKINRFQVQKTYSTEHNVKQRQLAINVFVGLGGSET